jgi:2-polyprenyl-3-methyl-5-hydroxy-6-metoxy-1,4-benzoquinol methylase
LNVYQDRKSKIIFLEKNLLNTKYYAQHYDNSILNNNKHNKIKPPNDDLRRLMILKKNIKKNKKILDFGCGSGSFLKTISNYTKNLYGVELKNSTVKKYSNNKFFLIKKNIEDFNIKFDIITMFHSLHYMPNQLEILRKIYFKLNKKGKLIIELPNATDLLFQLKSFRKFTLCKESLIWHTENSILVFLRKSGFKKIKINYIQRFGLINHLYWFIYGEPGGHNKYKNFFFDTINKFYINELKKNMITDTLWVEAIR